MGYAAIESPICLLRFLLGDAYGVVADVEAKSVLMLHGLRLEAFVTRLISTNDESVDLYQDTSSSSGSQPPHPIRTGGQIL